MVNIPIVHTANISQVKLVIKDPTGLIFNTIIINSEAPIYEYIMLLFPQHNILGPVEPGGCIRILNQANDTIYRVYTENL